MPPLTRSARWVCWFNSWLSGAAPLETAVDAVRAEDAAHHVLADTDGLVSPTGRATPVAETLLLAWGALRRAGATGARSAIQGPARPAARPWPPASASTTSSATCSAGRVPGPRRSGTRISGDRLRIDHATFTGAS